MGRLRFCVDEHVPHSFVTALDSNGYEVVGAVDEHGVETVDADLLTWASTKELVLVTNDRDFLELDAETDHAGILVYTTQSLSPGEFVTAVRRIDRRFSSSDVQDEVIWLEGWL